MVADDHFVPFQCSASFSRAPLLLVSSPTAQQLAAEVQRTPKSSSKMLLGFGTLPWDHVLPFQCRAWPTVGPLIALSSPTAQQFLAEVQETPSRLLNSLPGLGAETFDHAEPFQCSVWLRPVGPVVLSYPPTAQQFVDEGQETAFRALDLPGIGMDRPSPGARPSPAAPIAAAGASAAALACAPSRPAAGPSRTR